MRRARIAHKPEAMRSPILLATLALAACVPAGRPPAPPVVSAVPPPAAPTAPSPSADWRDWPVTPGTWRYDRQSPARSIATFGRAGPGFAIQLTCDTGARQLMLSLVAAPGAESIVIRTSTMVRTLPTAIMSRADAFNPATSDARLPATDPLLDAMAFSRGRFVVERPGSAPLVIPAWPEIGRVIEDCRG